MTTVRPSNSAASQPRTQSPSSAPSTQTKGASQGNAASSTSALGSTSKLQKDSFTASAAASRQAAVSLQARSASTPAPTGSPQGVAALGAAAPQPEYRYTVDVLNLRSVPSVTGNEPLGQIPPNSKLEVTPDASGATRQDDFVHVSWNDNGTQRNGWVYEPYTMSEPQVEPAPTGPTSPTDPTSPPQPASEYVRTTDDVRLRSVPTTAGNTPLGVVPQGTRLEVTPDASGETRKDGFVHVAWNDKGVQREGWVSEQYTRASSAPVPGAKSEEAALEDASGLYINQFDAEKQVGGDARNANCGPTSVVMALRAQGLEVPEIPGQPHNGTDGADIQAARFHMYNGVDGARDGVELRDPNDPSAGYQYAKMSGDGNENSSYTYFSEVGNAVSAAGGHSETIGADSASVAQALEDGKSVVLSGTFVEDGQEKTDTWTRGGGAEEHVVAVTGITDDGNFIVCDPAYPDRRPIVATPEQLDAFTRGNAGAIAVYP